MIITITLNPALDRTIYVAHPFALNKVNRTAEIRLEPGGKGINVSRAVKSLGSGSTALGFCAGSNGRVLKDSLTSMNIHHEFVDIPGQTRINIQILDPVGTHTELNEPGPVIKDGDYLRLLEGLRVYLESGNIFVMTGSVPPRFSVAHYGQICRMIKEAGCRLVIDSRGEFLAEALKYHPDLIKFKPYELATAVDDDLTNDPEELADSARKLIAMGAKQVMVSLGEKGAVFAYEDDPECLYVSTDPILHDNGSVGTGDALVAGAVHSMNKKFNKVDSAKLTVAFSRAASQIPGLDMPSMAQMYKVYESVKVYSIV